MANWWDDPDLQTSSKQPQQQQASSTSLWDSFKANVLDPATHALAVAGEGAVHAIPDTAGFIGDVGNQLLTGSVYGSPNYNNRPVPGTGPVSEKVRKSFDKAEQDYAGKNLPVPKNKVEEYLNTASRGAADAMVLGPEAPLRAIASGVSAATAGKATYDLTGNEDLANLATIAGGIAPEAIVGVRNARTGRMINDGMKHPDWAAVNDVIVGDLEGGGTLSNPKVSPKGAMGPQQVMPETAKKPGFGIRPWDGKSQADLARVGRQYSAAMMSKYGGDAEKVFAAYNAGPSRVDSLIKRYGDNWAQHLPAETQAYVAKGLGKLGVGPENLGPIDLVSREQPSISEQARFNEALAPNGNGPVFDSYNADGLMPESVPTKHYTPVVQFPGERIVNPDTVGPSSDIPFRMTEESGIPNLDDARSARYQRLAEENKQKLAEHDDAYVSNLQHQADNAKYVLDEHLSGNPVLSQGELEEMIQSWRDLNTRMSNSRLPALGHDVVKNVLSDISDFEKRNVNPNDLPDVLLDKETPPVVNKQEVSSKDINATPVLNKASNDGLSPFEKAIKSFKDMLNDESGSGPNPFDSSDDEGQPRTGYTPIDKLRQALKEAKPIRDTQEVMYSRARSKRMQDASDVGRRTSGEEGLYAELGAMKGALPKANYESIRGQFTQADLDGLFDHVKASPRLSYGESLRARVALGKMLGDRDANYATVPTDSEIQLLGKVFPKELIEELLRKKPLKDRVLHNIVSGLNVPRSLMASFDLSAPFRQGVFLVGRKEFWTSFDDMFKAFGSEKAFQAIQDEISARPTYRLMKKARLALSGADHVLSQREEAFMSDLAEKIPVAGKGVRASTRAYEGFLNKLRADTFDTLVKQSKEAGIDLEENQKALRDIARFVNAATGRGDLGALNQAAPVLSALFFSPRLMASRVQMLTDPRIYMASNPVVRKAAIKSLLSFSAIALTILGLAKAGGAKVSINPTDTDFGKIRIGDTRYDILGGFQQYIRLGARLITGKSTSNGKTRSLTSGKYGAQTRRDVVVDFFRDKESPVASFVDDVLSYPKDRSGQKITAKNELYSHFVPLLVQDTVDAVKEYGTKGYLSAIPGIFGIGVQTYKPKPKKERASSKKQWWEQ